jgi:tRNA-2-methylthio-N6-dimethylallyladenosine synthase
MNKSDSERICTVIENMGYKWTDNEEDAQLLGVLACSVRQKSIDKIYSRIEKWNRWKDSKTLLTFVSGCVLPADKVRFLKLFDLLFSVTAVMDLPEMIRNYGIVTPAPSLPGTGHLPLKEEPTEIISHSVLLKAPLKASYSAPRIISSGPDVRIQELWHVNPKYASPFEAFIPIQNGCDKFCTFCAVPYTRGREISRPSSDILKELSDLVEKGYRVITLLGQNVNSYGKDRHGSEITFTQLMQRIGEFGNASGKEFLVYFTSPHPRDINDELLKVIAKYRCLAKQIHLPLQSGDDAMLEAMNRRHTVAEYMKIIDSVRNHLGNATIFTDIITGFSGETPDQFENTRNVLKTVKFNMAYIAVYSPRPGAVSSAWPDDVPAAEKKKRLHILTEEVMVHALEYNNELMGKKQRVLVTGFDRKEGYLSGMTEGRIVVRFKCAKKEMTGKFVDVLITGTTAFSVEGELLE